MRIKITFPSLLYCIILINRNGQTDSDMEDGKTETDLTEIVKFDSSSLGRLKTSRHYKVLIISSPQEAALMT